MAKRLVFYLEGLAAVKELPLTVYRIEWSSTLTMVEIQEAMWRTYVGMAPPGRPDIVINAHERSNLKACETNPEAAWTENTLLPAQIAYAARTASIPFIQISTDHVFRGDRGPYSIEQAERRPLNIYGVTKWYAEMVVEKYYPMTDRGLGTTIVRTSELYGHDVESPPARLYWSSQWRTPPNTPISGTLREHHKMNPTFVGEAAFLLARNILLSEASLQAQYVHMASNDPPITWADYISQVESNIVKDEAHVPVRAEVPQGTLRGLVPSPGWFLPSGAQKSLGDFMEEYTPEPATSNGYIRYWNG